tara:strand:- start:40070 stop:40462 length:393 start_codon:yes stop_codon:yes gene_type:complete
MTKRRSPFPGQVLRKVFNWGDSSAEEPIEMKRPEVAGVKHADIITSEVQNTNGEIHKLVLDIDFPVKVVPSTTEGHFHLYIDKTMSKKVYFELVRAFVDAGLVEEGFLGASLERGFTGVRLPWIKKPQAL